jgi:hypothetical protein
VETTPYLTQGKNFPVEKNQRSSANDSRGIKGKAGVQTGYKLAYDPAKPDPCGLQIIIQAVLPNDLTEAFRKKFLKAFFIGATY